jgi:hypothetical protein
MCSSGPLQMKNVCGEEPDYFSVTWFW